MYLWKLFYFSKPEFSRKRLDFEENGKQTQDYGSEYEEDGFTYESPTQKEIRELRMLLEIKYAEIKATKLRVKKMEEDYVIPFQNDDMVGQRCGICHTKGQHNRKMCQNNRCITLKQCGHMRGHPDEKKVFDEEKAELKKLQREAKALEDKIEKKENAEKTVLSSFTEAIRKTVIESNPEKYMIFTPGGRVPINSVVQRDIYALQKMFRNELPRNYKQMGDTFQRMIKQHESQFEVTQHRDPILNTLKAKGVKFPEKAPPSESSSHDDHLDNDLELALRKSLYERSAKDIIASDILADLLKDKVTPENRRSRSPGRYKSGPPDNRTPTKSPLYKRSKSAGNERSAKDIIVSDILAQLLKDKATPEKQRSRSPGHHQVQGTDDLKQPRSFVHKRNKSVGSDVRSVMSTNSIPYLAELTPQKNSNSKYPDRHLATEWTPTKSPLHKRSRYVSSDDISYHDALDRKESRSRSPARFPDQLTPTRTPTKQRSKSAGSDVNRLREEFSKLRSPSKVTQNVQDDDINLANSVVAASGGYNVKSWDIKMDKKPSYSTEKDIKSVVSSKEGIGYHYQHDQMQYPGYTPLYSTLSPHPYSVNDDLWRASKAVPSRAMDFPSTDHQPPYSSPSFPSHPGFPPQAIPPAPSLPFKAANTTLSQPNSPVYSAKSDLHTWNPYNPIQQMSTGTSFPPYSGYAAPSPLYPSLTQYDIEFMQLIAKEKMQSNSMYDNFPAYSPPDQAIHRPYKHPAAQGSSYSTPLPTPAPKPASHTNTAFNTPSRNTASSSSPALNTPKLFRPF